MILCRNRGEVVLFLAEESLLFQVATWVRSEGRFSLRLVTSPDPFTTARALDEAAIAIVDATREPGEAMGILERSLRRLGPGRLVVYSERMHEGLELFVRVRCVPLLLGPMSPPEWEAVFEPLARISMPLAENM
jgi:hypothetical protein